MSEIISKEAIVLQQASVTKEQAIRMAGNLLVQENAVENAYVDKMLERESISTTYIGNGVAIPHGTDAAKENIRTSAISMLQYPDGVDFGNGNIAYVVFGIAGKDGEHLEILSKIAVLCSEEENVLRLKDAATKDEVLSLFEGADSI